MPLLTDDINQARSAYKVLEARANSAEVRAERLQADNAALRTRTINADPDVHLRQRILDLEGENFTLRTKIDQTGRVKSDVALQHFINSIGLAAALGEATMPDRAIDSIKAQLQTFLTPDASGIGLRFQPPELGATPAGLSNTSFEIVKVPPPPGESAPPNFYVVLQQIQRVYTEQFWLRFEPATQIIIEVAKVLASVGGWNAQFLVDAASAVAALQAKLVPLVAPTVADAAKDYQSAVEALRSLTDAQASKANLVAADIYALASALDSTTAAARSLMA